MESLNSKITVLENQVKQLIETVNSLSKNTVTGTVQPTSKTGNPLNTSTQRPAGISSASVVGGSVIWNDAELKTPPLNQEAEAPTKGYNFHVHHEFSGGALLHGATQVMELVSGGTTNIYSPNYWQNAQIATVVNTAGETVEKKGLLQLSFNADKKTWGIGEIDVETVNFVRYATDGTILKDSKNQEMKAPLYNADSKKSSIVWDETGKVWRLYAVYAPGELI